MKRTLLTVAAISAITAVSFAGAPQERGHGPRGGGFRHHGSPLEHLTETLNLTPDQTAKIQPIVDQAKPQIKAIHEEAMQKTKAVMDNAMAQIRPLLTPEQQTKADDLREAHQNLRKARKEMHEAKTN